MKKIFKILLIILSVLLILCAILGIWQRENISAFFNALNYSEEEISNLIEDNEKLVSEALNEYPEFEVPEIDETQIAALEEGKITEEDLVDVVLGNTSLENAIEKREDTQKNESSANNSNQPTKAPVITPEPTAPPKNGESEIAALVARVYILKQSYSNKLDALVNQTRAEYWAKPREERLDVSKQSYAKTKASEALALESECNAKIEEVLTELEAVLKENGKDLSLVTSIRKAYANEKQLKKSYYISKYLN